MTEGTPNEGLKRLGSRMQYYGIYIIISLIISVIITMSMSSSITRLVYSASSIREVLIGFRSIMKGTLTSLYIISLIDYLLFALIIYSLYKLRNIEELDKEKMNATSKLLQIGFLILILEFIIGFAAIVDLFAELDTLIASQSVTIEQFEQITNNIQGESVIVNLLDLLVNVVFAFTFFRFDEWLQSLFIKFGRLQFQDAKSGISKIMWGYVLSAFANVVAIFPNQSIGGLISFIALILMIYGFIKTGSSLSNLPDRLERPEPIINKQEEIEPGIRCVKCNYEIQAGNNFCMNCGNQIGN